MSDIQIFKHDKYEIQICKKNAVSFENFSICRYGNCFETITFEIKQKTFRDFVSEIFPKFAWSRTRSISNGQNKKAFHWSVYFLQWLQTNTSVFTKARGIHSLTKNFGSAFCIAIFKVHWYNHTCREIICVTFVLRPKYAKTKYWLLICMN